MAVPNTTANAGTHISDIITADCDLLNATAIEQNPAPNVFTGYLEDIRAWDKVRELVGMGDGVNPWEIDITVNGGTAYHAKSNKPRWEWYGGGRGIVPTGGSMNAWQMKPGVIAFKTLTPKPTPDGAFLTSRNHNIIDQIVMATGQDSPSMVPVGADIYEVQREAQFQREWIDLYEKGEVYL